jgi:hypothetical protein
LLFKEIESIIKFLDGNIINLFIVQIVHQILQHHLLDLIFKLEYNSLTYKQNYQLIFIKYLILQNLLNLFIQMIINIFMDFK